MGDSNASIPTPQPVYDRPMFGAFGLALPKTCLTFVSQAAIDAGVVERYGLQRQVVPVENCRGDRQEGHEEQRRHAEDRGGPRHLPGLGRRRESPASRRRSCRWLSGISSSDAPGRRRHSRLTAPFETVATRPAPRRRDFVSSPRGFASMIPNGAKTLSPAVVARDRLMSQEWWSPPPSWCEPGEVRTATTIPGMSRGNRNRSGRMGDVAIRGGEIVIRMTGSSWRSRRMRRIGFVRRGSKIPHPVPLPAARGEGEFGFVRRGRPSARRGIGRLAQY